MADILHEFPIAAPIDRVFWGVSAPGGLDQWWTLSSHGEPVIGSEYQLYFGPQWDWRAHVADVQPARLIDFEMTVAKDEWQGTHVRFELAPHELGTLLSFSHRGWEGPVENYRVSSFCWAMYLRVLRRHLEHGESVPYDQRLIV